MLRTRDAEAARSVRSVVRSWADERSIGSRREICFDALVGGTFLISWMDHEPIVLVACVLKYNSGFVNSLCMMVSL